ncbi:MAG: hypothetical protein ACRBN8_12110 [Nannocystales bacterium]
MTVPRPLSRDAAQFVDAFRDEVAVDPDVSAAWAQFEEEIQPPKRPGSLVWLGAAVAVAAAAVLVWGVVSTTSMQGAEAERGQQASDRAATESGRVAPSRSVEPESTPAPTRHPKRAVVVPSAADVEPEEETPRRPATAGPGRAPTAKRDEAPAASRLAEELRLLDKMRAASKAGRHTQVLRLVAQHASAFASGPFAAERELAKVRALCGLGRLKQVRAAQSGFAKSHPASHLASLVRDACPRAAKEIEKTDHDR